MLGPAHQSEMYYSYIMQAAQQEHERHKQMVIGLVCNQSCPSLHFLLLLISIFFYQSLCHWSGLYTSYTVFWQEYFRDLLSFKNFSKLLFVNFGTFKILKKIYILGEITNFCMHVFCPFCMKTSWKNLCFPDFLITVFCPLCFRSLVLLGGTLFCDWFNHILCAAPAVFSKKKKICALFY